MVSRQANQKGVRALPYLSRFWRLEGGSYQDEGVLENQKKRRPQFMDAAARNESIVELLSSRLDRVS